MAFVVEMVSAVGDPHPQLRPQFSCHFTVWNDLLSLGREHGWQPQRPIEHATGASAKDYEPSDWWEAKQVIADDAAQWADALERAAPQIPVNVSPPQPVLMREDMAADELKAANRGLTRDLVQDFVAFLRLGAFSYGWDD